MRRGESLYLFAGVPPSWLSAGRSVGFNDLPTEFGALSVRSESNLNTDDQTWDGTLTVTISGGANPPGGFVWKLPRSPARVNGPAGAEVRDGQLLIPGSGGVVSLEFQR